MDTRNVQILTKVIEEFPGCRAWTGEYRLWVEALAEESIAALELAGRLTPANPETSTE